MNFRSKIKPKNPEKSQKKKDIFKNLYAPFDDRERVLDVFESKILPIKIEGTNFSDLPSQDKVSEHSNLRILSPKKMLPKLQIALTQLKPGNTSENLLNEIRQIIYFLYEAKAITKKVYNNIMNLI